MQVESITGIPVLPATPATRPNGKPTAPSAESKTSATLTLPGAKSDHSADALPTTQEPNVEQAIQALEEAVQAFDIALNFSRDEETGAIVVKLIDQHSGEIVQQIPNEVTLHLSAVLGKLQGQLFDRQA